MLSLTDSQIALVHCLLHDSKSTPLTTACPSAARLPNVVVKAGSESTAKLRLVSAVCKEGRGGGARCGRSRRVGAHYDEGEHLRAWQDGPFWEHAPGIYCTPQSKSRAGGGAESVERPAGVLAARDVLGGVGGAEVSVKLQQSMH